jgi:hypothetical protein
VNGLGGGDILLTVRRSLPRAFSPYIKHHPEKMKVYYDKDCDLSLIKGRQWPSSAMAVRGMLMHKTNDSGVKVVVGLRKGGASWDKARLA